MKESENVSCSVMSDSLQPHGLQPARFLCPWNSSGANSGVGSCSLLQGIFPTQGSNPGLLHCRQILYHPSYQGSPEITYLFKKVIKPNTLHFVMPVTWSRSSWVILGYNSVGSPSLALDLSSSSLGHDQDSMGQTIEKVPL